MAKSTRASLKQKCDAIMEQHLLVVDNHIRAMKSIEIQIRAQVREGTITSEWADRTLEDLRPFANQASQMHADALGVQEAIPRVKHVREDDDDPPIFDGVSELGQVVKRRKLTPSSLQSSKEQSQAEHAYLDPDEPMTDVSDETDDDSASVTMTTDEDDFNDQVEQRLKLQRERRTHRINNPGFFVRATKKPEAAVEKRKRLSDAEGVADLRPKRDGAAVEPAAKRKKGAQPGSSLKERGESLRRRSRDFFMRAAEADRPVAAGRGKKRGARAAE